MSAALGHPPPPGTPGNSTVQVLPETRSFYAVGSSGVCNRQASGMADMSSFSGELDNFSAIPVSCALARRKPRETGNAMGGGKSVRVPISVICGRKPQETGNAMGEYMLMFCVDTAPLWPTVCGTSVAVSGW